MSADADRSPTDPFLNPRRSTGASRSRADNDGAMVVEVVHDGQTTPSSSAAPAAPFATRGRPSATVARGESPKESMAHLASNAATSTSAAAMMPHSRKRERPAVALASAGSPTSTTAAPPLVQKRRIARQQKSGATPSLSRRAGSAARTIVDRGQHSAKDRCDEDALAEGAGGECGSDHAEGYASDDDEEGDAEERALVSASIALMAGQGALTAPSAASATPHSWLVTDAFHVCLWYVLRYAGRALSVEDLWACRALLSLTAVDATEEEDGGERATAPFAAEQARSANMRFDDWAWSGSEESELLLRLLLRHAHSFTARHLELRYGDWLHVQLALNALTQRRFLWWATKQASLDSAGGGAEAVCLHGAEEDAATDLTETPLIPADELACTEMAPSPLVEHYDGARVARLLLSCCDEDWPQHRHATAVSKSASTFSSVETVIRVAQAVRATELRTFLTTLRHCSKARALMDERARGGDGCITTRAIAPTTTSTLGTSGNVLCKDGSVGGGIMAEPTPVLRPKSGDWTDDVACVRPGQISHNSLYDVIPGRKRDMIRYLAERRYSVWVPSSTVNSSPAASATTDAATTDTMMPSHGPPPTEPHALSSVPLTTRPSPRGAVRCTSVFASAPDRSPFRRCFPTVSLEADAVAQCWDRIIGSVYVPHSGLRQHLTWITELFHVLTSNNGAGMVSGQGAKAVAATMTVATPPTLLMVRPQLLLLLQTLGAARHQARPSLTEPSPSTAAHPDPKAFKESVPHALLPQWCSPPPVVKATKVALPRVCGQLHRDISSNGRAANKTESQPRPDASAKLNDSHSSLMDTIVHTSRSFQDFGAAEDGTVTQVWPTPPHVCLFSSPVTLQEYRRALSTQRELYCVTEGAVTVAQRHRGKSSTFVSHMYDTVMAAVRAGVAAVKQHPHHARTAASASLASVKATHLGSMHPPVPPVVSEAAPLSKHFTQSVTASLESLVYQQGCHAEHLLIFTPLYRWFACLELLFPLLQSARRYDDANACLHHLLYEPIFVLHHMPVSSARCPISPVTYAFRYKPHKRGKWLARLAQNLSHQKRYAEAFAVLEEAQAGYRELASHTADDARSVTNDKWLPCDVMSNSTAAALCDVLAGNHSPASESALPLKVQRRGRMLRVLWPAAASAKFATGDNNASPPAAEGLSPDSLALLHAAWEYVRDRYYRRQDRLTLERLLAMTHRKVRQWTPLAAHLEFATRRFVDVAMRRIGGVRDKLDRMLWREPSGQAPGCPSASAGGVAEAAKPTTPSGVLHPQRRPALPVELLVLQHYLSRWNGTSRTTAADSNPAADPQHRRRKGTLTTNSANEQTEGRDNAGGAKLTSLWCGVHCEGQWIACLARALLWDCYWAFPFVSSPLDSFPVSARDHESDQPLPPTSPTHEVLWLSAFQDGPLDLTTPIQFLWRRRALIEARLAQLERCTREELIAYVGARIKVEGNTDDKALPSKLKTQGRDAGVEAPRKEAHGVQRADEDKGYSRDEEQARRRRSRDEYGCGPHSHSYTAKVEEEFRGSNGEDSVQIAPSLPATPLLSTGSETSLLVLGRVEQERNAEAQRVESVKDSADASLSPRAPTLAVPEAWKVPVRPLPLLDILRAIPLKPLWRLLRCLYLSPVTEGVPLAFSGFPDLVFWLTGGSGGSECGNAAVQPSVGSDSAALRTSFCLMEVKGPSDFLSTKQIAVNDLLHRCGFEVCVVRVDEVYDDGQRVSTKRIR
ncbi:conserved hypothetical protein [Leishmania major strain Friedlin]|uniref:Fanconi-associated nuclease n=1 Tax=Leishmania major TaxID=5664 RepID=Q4Q1F9_LEIMA|nr:conserved hypothetical protein [Leishmania major strain Friedlin]CAG9583794.1 VRR-NUC_domain_containing_protein_-_putative [Leishmania major strain Friedlin]CAJ09220.1 conserved hypothetical protein [Leishmania major strain Friedlin]|eukprot:XP_001686839.1 conserved hypothetical protein [Leishmania major strain Friedlin]